MYHNGSIFISIGSNLSSPDGRLPLLHCNAAAESLRALQGLRLGGISRWYATDSIPPGAPSYINGIARLEGDTEPATLLYQLQSIERAAGRVRTFVNAPRVLDLDIVAIGDLVRQTPDPILPHPRAHLRRFVLEPLAELAPSWVHPVLKRSVSELLAGLPDQGVNRL